MKKISFFAFLLLLMTACDPGNASSNADSSVSTNNTSESMPATKEPTKPELDAEYTMFRNMEMIEYCLPYPKDNFSEDFSASNPKGMHVLVSNDKEGTITFSGNELGMPFEELYALCETDIMNLTGDAPEAMEMHQENSFSMSWQHRGKWHTLIKWHLPEHQETVTAQFDYPEDQMDYYDKVIAVIRAKSPKCPA